MNHPIRTITFLLIAGAAAAVAWHNAHQTRLLNAQIAAANDRTAKEKTALVQAMGNVKNIRAEIARLATRRAASTTAGSPRPNATPRTDWGEWLKKYEAKERDPKVQLRDLAANRAKLHQSYSPFFRKLALSPEKSAAIEESEARQTEQQADVIAAIKSLGLNPGEALRDPAMAAQLTKFEMNRDAEERAALGDAGFEQLNDYRRTLPAREIVRGYAASATVAGEPLSASQTEALVSAIASASPTYAHNGVVSLFDVDWTRVDQAMAGQLSARQTAIIQTADVPPTGGRSWNALCKEYSTVVMAESHPKP